MAVRQRARPQQYCTVRFKMVPTVNVTCTLPGLKKKKKTHRDRSHGTRKNGRAPPGFWVGTAVLNSVAQPKEKGARGPGKGSSCPHQHRHAAERGPMQQRGDESPDPAPTPCSPLLEGRAGLFKDVMLSLSPRPSSPIMRSAQPNSSHPTCS